MTNEPIDFWMDGPAPELDGGVEPSVEVAFDCGGGGNIKGITVFLRKESMWKREKVAYGIKVTM